MTEVEYLNHLVTTMTYEQAYKVMDHITLDDLNAPHAANLEIWEHEEHGTMIDLIDKMDHVVTRLTLSEL